MPKTSHRKRLDPNKKRG